MHDNSGYISHPMGEQQMNYHFQMPLHSYTLDKSRPHNRSSSFSSADEHQHVDKLSRIDSDSSSKKASSENSGVMANGRNGSGGHLSSHSNNSSDHSEHGDHDSLHNGHIEEYQPTNKAVAQKERHEAWWSIGEFTERGRQVTHQSAMLTLTGNRVFGSNNKEEVWDLTDSLAELYEASYANTLQQKKQKGLEKIDIKEWLAKDSSHGFIRVYPPDMSCFTNSQLVPCTLSTTAHKICLMLGLAVNALHIQLNGDKVRRLDPYEHPLVLQNEYLAALGFSDVSRIQQEGAKEDLAYLVKFYSGKPMVDSTFSRNQLQAFIDIKKGKMMSNWVKRLCVISGTRLLIHKDKQKKDKPSVLQLAKGQVEEVEDKGHQHVLRLTCTLDGDKLIYLAFSDTHLYNKWYRKCKKATDKLPTAADLSNCHLEFLPETVFINDQLAMLNLRHNVLKERPIEEDIYTIGWLDDLPRFSRLRSLNLADNNLMTFPLALCNIRTLVELNIASNKLEEIPPDIQLLTNLQALHVHNNHLSTLPAELTKLSKLFILVLAFNHFSTLPPVVALMTDVRVSEVENIILAGNQIEEIPADTLMRMKYVKKADFRMNNLTLSPSETVRFSVLEHLTHLDVRDNCVVELDIRAIKTLEYLNVERNDMTILQVNGMQLKNLFAAHNRIERLSVSPKPEWLLQVDLSYNLLRRLPDWLSDCFFLQKLNAAHNLLTELPPRIFVDAKKLKSLRVNHNRLIALPPDVDCVGLEELHVQHNLISRLPNELLAKLNKLRVFNATKNRLQMLPELNQNQDLNKVQEIYLTGNMLGDSAMESISGYRRLKVLHIAHNEIHNLYDNDLKKLDMLQELNISGNQLRSLPPVLGTLSKLVILRAHSNILQGLPDFKTATSLRILDFGHNQLLNVSVTNLMASQLNLLDMSLNAQLKVDPREFKSVKHRKSVCLVDSSGQNRVLPGLNRRPRPETEDYETDPSLAWKVGFSETSGIRNKLCIATLRILKFENENESLFGMFDGGHNNEVPSLLLDQLPSVMRDEMRKDRDGDRYMKYTLLTAHRKLGSAGQKLGACCAICHIRCVRAASQTSAHAAEAEGMNHYSLTICNVGDVEMVLCRRGEALCLTRKFTTSDDADECYRVYKSDGIITEDNKVNGTTKNTRCVGNSYLYPYVIPDPYTATIALRHDDEFLIIANRGLWRYASYEEAVEEVYEIGNPVVAAKKLQDLAQGYGSKENIGILVVRLNTDRGPSLARLRQHKSMSIDDVQAAAEYEEKRLQQQRSREERASQSSNGPSTAPSAAPSAAPSVSSVAQRRKERAPLPPGKPERRKKVLLDVPREGEPDMVDSTTSSEFFRDGVNVDGSPSLRSRSPKIMRRSPQRSPEASTQSMSPLPDLKPLPNQRYRKKNAARDWESLLQNRLSEDVKDKEMKQFSRTVSEESMASSKNSVRQSKTLKTVNIELDTSQNVDMSNPHLEPVKPKRIITQPPFLSEQPAGQVNPMQLVEAAEEDKELDLTSAVMADNGQNKAVIMRAKNAENSNSTGQKQKPTVQVRNTIALFENMNQLPPQPEVNKKTTVVVIQRDERGPDPSSPTRENPSSEEFEPSKYNVEVLKFKGASSDSDLSPEVQTSKHAGSVEANLYSGVRKVSGAHAHHKRSHVGSTEIHVQEEEDEDGEVRIVEIARL